jgi:predicted protein tyrosine phosphatase
MPEPTAPRNLIVCGLQELGSFRDSEITHILSILDPHHPDPEDFAGYRPHERLTLRFDDVLDPAPGMLLPQREHIEALLTFGEGLAAEGEPFRHLLIHCHAGISRSTAAMSTLLAEARPSLDEDAIFAEIRAIRPQAWPNSLMVAFADELLGREGRLVAALRRHYGIQMRSRPDLAQMIERVGRQKEVQMAA